MYNTSRVVRIWETKGAGGIGFQFFDVWCLGDLASRSCFLYEPKIFSSFHGGRDRKLIEWNLFDLGNILAVLYTHVKTVAVDDVSVFTTKPQREPAIARESNNWSIDEIGNLLFTNWYLCVCCKKVAAAVGKLLRPKFYILSWKTSNRHFMTESSVKNISIVSRSLEAKLIIDWLVSLGGQKNI